MKETAGRTQVSGEISLCYEEPVIREAELIPI